MKAFPIVSIVRNSAAPDRLREPVKCPRCPATGPFTYDEETHTWICHTCAHTWSAGVDEVGR